jgi:hypothetical protein
MKPAEIAEMLRAMEEGDSDEMDFVVTREKQEVGRTISEEALASLQATVNSFIEARILHHWKAKPDGVRDVGPSVIKAEVRLTVDGMHIVPDPDARPWWVIDGQRRLDA